MVEQNNHNGALQRPLKSGFNATSTTNDVIKGIDLKGKIAIVTGGSTGIGLERVKILSGAGATVVVPERNIKNTGIMFVPLRRDAKGNGSQLATNYLSVFELTARLWEPLKKQMLQE
ncbi:MAG: hypothetical protein ABIN24_11630 [Dyadobacter sp.]